MAATSRPSSHIAMLYRSTGEPRYLEFCHAIIDAGRTKTIPRPG